MIYLPLTKASLGLVLTGSLSFVEVFFFKMAPYFYLGTFMHFPHTKLLLTKVLLDIKTLEVFLATLTIVRPPLESWYKSLEPGKKRIILKYVL